MARVSPPSASFLGVKLNPPNLVEDAQARSREFAIVVLDHATGDLDRPIQEAARAVAAGRYGKAPAEQVRSTRPYRLWADLWAAVEGETEGSLLRALEDRGFVKRRGR